MGSHGCLISISHLSFLSVFAPPTRNIPLGPLGFEGAQHRQTLRPSSSRDPQQSPASFRSAVKDLEDPAVPVQMARSEWLKGDPKVGHVN